MYSRDLHRIISGFSLPCRALQLIHEYSRPMTRPDWRHSKPIINTYQLFLNIQYDSFPKYKLLHKIILYNIYNTYWFYAYQYIKYYGSLQYSCLDLSPNILKMDGIEEARKYYWLNSLNYEL
jgi:hypothetical protein